MRPILQKNRSANLAPILLLLALAGCTPSGTTSTNQPATLYLSCPPTTQFETNASANAAYDRTQGHYDLAVIEDTKIIQFGQSSDCDKFAAYLDRAHDETFLSKYDLAVADATTAVNMHLDDAVADTALALADANEHHTENAIIALNQAIAADPSFAPAYTSRASIEGSRGEYQKSIADDTTAISLSPGLTKAYADRAIVFAAEHDYDDEIADETKVISLDPNSNFSYILRSFAYQAKGQRAQAGADHDTALKLNPTDSIAWNNSCWFLAHVDDLPEALASCEQSLSMAPGAYQTLDSTGFVYLKMKNYSQAITYYNNALQARPNLPTSLYGRGLAEQAEGNTQAATADINAAKAITPNIATDISAIPY